MTRMQGRGGGFCCWCKRGPLLASTDKSKLAFTRDHINPRARGGGRTVPCCRQCNELKADIHPDEWMWFIDNTPQYWKQFRSTRQVDRAITDERVRRVFAGEPPIVPLRVVLTDEEMMALYKTKGSAVPVPPLTGRTTR